MADEDEIVQVVRRCSSVLSWHFDLRPEGTFPHSFSLSSLCPCGANRSIETVKQEVYAP